MVGRIVSTLFISIFLLVTFTVMSEGQDLDDVTIAGKVSDVNGLAIVGVSVTATTIGFSKSKNSIGESNGW